MRAWLPMKKLLVLCLPLFALNSCSLMFEAATITRNRAREVAPGESIAGEGFAVQVPEKGLYAERDDPEKGGVCFRPVDTWRDGLVYSVSPFRSTTARTPEEALDEWYRRPALRGRQFQTSGRSPASFAGLKGTQAIVTIPMDERGGLIGATLVLWRGNDFLILTRGDLYRSAEEFPRAKARCKAGLRDLMQHTKLTSR